MKHTRVDSVAISFFVLLLYRDTVAGTTILRAGLEEISIVCGENEVFSSCGADPTCEKSCEDIDNWDSGPCSIREKNCVSGCVCEDGYVRDEYRLCVWENRCPRVRH
ncbi:serine protease inhibitor [Ptiloglossa arizonensis]|uniref:serine protease inhibitor n=1 Tax=Ptiloglossa arizonensis TaxID=3350558 RepID=UPI003FA0AFC6